MLIYRLKHRGSACEPLCFIPQLFELVLFNDICNIYFVKEMRFMHFFEYFSQLVRSRCTDAHFWTWTVTFNNFLFFHQHSSDKMITKTVHVKCHIIDVVL